MSDPGGQEQLGIPEQPKHHEVDQTGFFGELRSAAQEDYSGLNFLQRTKSRSHAIGSLAAYAYQMTFAAPVGVGAWIEGYSNRGFLGAVEAGLMLGGVVGVQHLIAGQNSVEAAAAYPRAGSVIRQRFPRFSGAVATYWEANSGTVSNGAAVSSVGVQSAVYNEAYTVHPDSSEKELRSYTNKAILRGTCFSTGVGVVIGGVGKGLQRLATISGNHVADIANRGFDREVIDRPIRTASIVLGLTVLNGANKALQRIRDERSAESLAPLNEPS